MAGTTATHRSTRDGRALDWGRLVMVPFGVLAGAAAVGRVIVAVSEDTASAGTTTLAVLTGALTACFYALIIWAYLRRGPASRTTSSPTALLAAPVATFLPFVLPFVGRGNVSTMTMVVGDILLAAGLAFSVWSIRHLDRNLSVVAQAREVVDTGPYAAVRHPLYVGELVAMLGVAITLGGVAVFVIWTLLVLLQAYRAVHEEALLAAVLPAYAGYRQRTARLLPGVF